jgi:hypothetical protein
MDDRPTAPEEAEIVAESRRYLVTGDAEGYTIWDLRDDAEAPIADFPSGVEGQDDALDAFERLNGLVRRERLLAGLAWLAVGIGAVWLLYLAILSAVAVATVVTGDPRFVDGLFEGRFAGVFVPMATIPTAFTVAVGLYVVVWMQLRSRRRGD